MLIAHLPAPDERHALLLECIRLALGLPGEPRPVPSGFDWDSLLELAAEHRVLGCLSDGLETHKRVPRQAVARAKAERMACAQRNVSLAHELNRVAAALVDANVPFLAFGGPVAAKQIHGGLNRRPSDHLDLLARPAHWRRAAHVLRSLGYEDDEWRPRSLHGCLRHPEKRAMVHLHWGIPPARLRFNERLMWRNRTTVDLFGSAVPTFSREVAVIVAALHLTKELWGVRLHAIVDVLVALRGIDARTWASLRTRARRIGAERALLAAGYVCARCFPRSLPIDVKQQCREHKAAARVGEELARQLFRNTGHHGMQVFPFAHDYELALEDRWWRRACRMIHRAVRPNAA